jgi:hypothetical protein
MAKFTTIPLQACESSRIAEHGYDQGTKTLALRFKSGVPAVYTYADVPPELYEQMTAAKSIGVFFGQHVQGKFPHTKHEETNDEENT